MDRAGNTEHELGGLLQVLRAICERVMLDADDRATSLSALLPAIDALREEDGRPPLLAALVKETRAHASELAFRLEQPGIAPIHLRATAARLCQTVAALRQHSHDDTAAEALPRPARRHVH
ncbi:MAG: hypothetical protein ACOY4R_12100 [Pseudomonadota bacterium]